MSRATLSKDQKSLTNQSQTDLLGVGLHGWTGFQIFFISRLPTDPRGQAQVAQLVEQRTENPRVAGSIPALGTI